MGPEAICTKGKKKSLISIIIDALNYILCPNFPFIVLKGSQDQGPVWSLAASGPCVCGPDLGLAGVCVRKAATPRSLPGLGIIMTATSPCNSGAG